MADRTSAALFADLFESIASGNTLTAQDTWDMIGGYDFQPYQMGCDGALETLNLMRQCNNEDCPDYEPGHGGVHVYGPAGQECDSCGKIPTS